MVRPNYGDFRRSQFVLTSGQHLEHSAKGSTWKEHKYIKRIDGTYYYPEDYDGGRHLPDGEKSDDSSDLKNKSNELEDWEEALYEDVKETLKRNPVAFNPKDLTNEDFQDFRLTLAEFAGIDSDKLSDAEVERMRQKVQEHYEDMEAARTLNENDIEKLANEVIRGNFGNGQTRKDLLGQNYDEVQKRVNEILSGSSSSKIVSEASKESISKVEEVVKNIADKKVHSGVDMDTVLSVYKKKK